MVDPERLKRAEEYAFENGCDIFDALAETQIREAAAETTRAAAEAARRGARHPSLRPPAEAFARRYRGRIPATYPHRVEDHRIAPEIRNPRYPQQLTCPGLSGAFVGTQSPGNLCAGSSGKRLDLSSLTLRSRQIGPPTCQEASSAQKSAVNLCGI